MPSMAKFYAKIDEAVEGPFEPHLLRYLPGFSEETLVSPEDLSAEDWIQALHVPEIRPHIQLTQVMMPPSAFAPRAAETVPAPASAAPQSESTVRMTEAPPLPPAPIPDHELLDVMEQISGQLPAANPVIPNFIPPDISASVSAESQALASDVSTLVPPQQEKFIPKRAKRKKWVWVAALLALLTAAALGYMAFKMGMLDAWLNPAPAPVVEVPPPPPPEPVIQENPVEPPKPPEAKKPAKKAPKPPSIKEKPKAKKTPPPPPAPKPVKEAPLKNQKYMMPGVPSPKVQEKSKEAEAAKPAEQAEPAPDAAPAKKDDEYDRELKKAKAREDAEKKKAKKKTADDEDYFDFQWIGADPGEKR